MDNSPFLPKGVAVGASDGSATMIDTLAPTQSATGRLSFKPTGLARSPLRAVAFSPHAPYWLATAGSDAVVRVWDTRYNGRPMRELFGHTVGVTSVPLRTIYSPFSKNEYSLLGRQCTASGSSPVHWISPCVCGLSTSPPQQRRP